VKNTEEKNLKAMNRASMTCIKKYNPHVIGIPEREENK
jgi:hypothetical protein